MYFIGIDISKFKHDCAIIDEAGDTVTASWSFANNCEGFSLLKQLLDALDTAAPQPCCRRSLPPKWHL